MKILVIYHVIPLIHKLNKTKLMLLKFQELNSTESKKN